MSDTPEGPWSSNPNAPQIPYPLYLGEKDSFAGTLIGVIFYGVVVVLFFRCASALLYPADRTKGGIKWGLVAHTMAMFLSVTIYTATSLEMVSIGYINNREFPGDGVLFPGPLGYQFLVNSGAITVTGDVMLILNGWLADGLLLYRCYVIYATNYWVIAFPCLMYLATWALGITLIYYQASTPYSVVWDSANPDFGAPYYAISFSLNIILTLMIIIRLALHSKNIQNAMGAAAGANNLHKAVITMLVESAALYAVAAILYIGTWGASNPIQFVFLPILAEIQVIAPLLIIIRVADRRALTSETVASGNIGSIQFRSQGRSTVDSGSVPDGDPVSSTDLRGETASEHGAEDVIEEVSL